MIESLLPALSDLLTGQGLFVCLAGALLGTLVGILPGLNPGTAVALLLPVAAWLPLEQSLALMFAIAFASQYAGSTGAILAGLPGETSSAVSCLAGHAMARDGRGREALLAAAVASLIGGLFSLTVNIGLIAVAGHVLKPSPMAYLVVGGLAMAIFITVAPYGRKKTAGALLLGLALTMILVGGKERPSALPWLAAYGMDPGILAIALFGVSYAVHSLRTPSQGLPDVLAAGGQLTLAAVRRILPASVRGSIVGLLALVPGIGYPTLCTLAYSLERGIQGRSSSTSEAQPECVAAPEAANNAAAQCSLFMFGGLGTATGQVTSVLASLMLAKGIELTPHIAKEQPALIAYLAMSVLVVNVFAFVLNLPDWSIWPKVLRWPERRLNIGILVAGLLGIGFLVTRTAEIPLAVGVTLIGLWLRHKNLPVGPVFVGSIMGLMLEDNLLKLL